MPDYEDLKTDCRHFRWDRPCAPHKTTGVTCPECTQYDRIGQRVAVVKLAAVGDVLRTTALLPAIRARFPGAWITWITAPEARGLFDGNDLVDEVWSMDDARVRVQEFDAVLCPDADPQTTGLAASLRGSVRLGYTMDERGGVVSLGAAAEHWLRMGTNDILKKSNVETYQTLVARVLDLAPEDVAEPILNPSAQQTERAREFRSRLLFEGKFVGLNTGAGHRWERKRWTVAHQKTFIAELSQRGIGVLLFGGPEEAGRHGELLIPSSPESPVVSVGTDHTFGEFAAFVELCDVLVTGDTMALHVACARRVPVVALFGPTSMAEIEVYGRGEKIAPEGLDCLGCYLPTCDVSPHCQERIMPRVVIDAVERLLVAGYPPPVA